MCSCDSSQGPCTCVITPISCAANQWYALACLGLSFRDQRLEDGRCLHRRRARNTYIERMFCDSLVQVTSRLHIHLGTAD